MITRKLLLLSVSVIALLVFSTMFVAMPITPRASAQQKIPGANWEYIDYDSHGTNFNPQTQITKNNVQFLELKWIYPVPATTAAGGVVNLAGGFLGRTFHEGSTTPPLVVDGVVYFVTNYYGVIAVDAATGKNVWTYQYSADIPQAQTKGLPIGAARGHLHGFYYIDGNLIFSGVVCDIIAVNALTGKLSWKIEDVCANIPGNAGFYSGGYGYPPVLYRKGNTLIVVSSVVEGMTGRGFVSGYDMTTRQLKWRFFTAPPAGGDPDWAVRVRDKIWIQGIKGTDIPVDLLKNDWGNLGTKEFQGKTPWETTIRQTLTRAGTGTEWGQMAVDEDTGIVYLGLSQPSPDWNATERPGPNLFSASVLAINANTGELVWAHQQTTHDLMDYDCSWNVVLGNIGSRKVIFKGCKNGILYAFDAATGENIWYFNPPSTKRSDWTPFHADSKLNSGPKDNSLISNWDPRNPDTFKRPWANWPSKDAYWQNPFGGGGIESDIAYDGNTLYVATFNTWSWTKAGPINDLLPLGTSPSGTPPEVRPSNTTIYAIDAATGKPKWSYFIAGIGYRGGLVVSGGVLYAASANGNLYALSADTGQVLFQKYFGNKLNIPPTIGATVDGKMRLFQLMGGTGDVTAGWGGFTNAPGALMVFGLPDKLPEPQVITKEVVKEVIKEVPRDVIREVVKEVPKEVVKEVVKEVPKEVIKEVPKEVVKEVTKTVTVETISPISYGAIGVSIVILVISGVLLTRRKKA